jgi:hypothetical protein
MNLESGDQVIEHPATEKQAMPENYGLISGTLILVVEVCAINILERHDLLIFPCSEKYVSNSLICKMMVVGHVPDEQHPHPTPANATHNR